MKKIPMRTCIVTKEKCEKRDLLRIVRTPEKEIIIDESGKANGRGAYLKKDKDVILNAKRTKVLEKTLEVSIPDNIYEEMLKKIN
jgi:hypothetical protein